MKSNTDNFEEQVSKLTIEEIGLAMEAAQQLSTVGTELDVNSLWVALRNERKKRGMLIVETILNGGEWGT